MPEVFDQEYENYQDELGKDSQCKYCGETCSDSFCSKDCQIGYEHDMFDD